MSLEQGYKMTHNPRINCFWAGVFKLCVLENKFHKSIFSG